MAVKVPDVLLAYANNITFHKKLWIGRGPKPTFFFFSQSRQCLCLFIFYLLVSYTTLLLFNYSCLHFLPTTLPHPIQTYLPTQLPPFWGLNSV